MKNKIHAFAGAVSLLLISSFFVSTIIVELIGSYAQIAMVKQLILGGLFFLVPLLVVAGASGNSLAVGWKGKWADKKKTRMKIAAANGLLVLLPSAIFLANRAVNADFDSTFYVVQCVELISGMANICLLGLNMRDGVKLAGRKLRSHPTPALGD
jgi:hypothetical protein